MRGLKVIAQPTNKFFPHQGNRAYQEGRHGVLRLTIVWRVAILLPSRRGLFALAVVMLCLMAGCTGCGEETPEPPPEVTGPAPTGQPTVIEASDTLSIFDQYKFQEVHRDFQQSYLELVKDISDQSSPKVDTQQRRTAIARYSRSRQNYAEVLKKINDHEKNARLKCFATMKSLVRGILFYDQKTQKKTARYDPEKLVKEGIFTVPPTCPGGGTYSIIIRDGRRFFHCNIHGTLKQ